MVFGQVVSLLLGLGATSVEEGFGTMLRKYDLAADNIIDAYIVDVDGRILVRDKWARIRFGSSEVAVGGANFGVILSFTIKLVRVPTTVTSSIFQGNWKKMILNWDIDLGRNQGSKCHDYEGLSYTSQKPFVIIDLANLRKITINTVDESAWIEAGGTFGELNYQIAKKTTHLVSQPVISKNLEEGATKLVYNWQNVAHKLHKDLNLEKIREAEIKGLYLGGIKHLMPLINSSSPELDLKEQDCREMRWLESILYFDNGYSKNESTDHRLVSTTEG
ncbi:hypothetical protein RHSIM_Rhsim03G0093300 [Rhododendron simsii]|uniref:Uncharacterized protein n=1 Tax=Rhododendron simsii TaxID=118357 RepID=A0A834LQE7_RHOSS|nr:hypothetical protein RHSIM_Rhsim03G0093300 [Rhododendron simsii]